MRFAIGKQNRDYLIEQLDKALESTPVVEVTISDPAPEKMPMLALWRSWMDSTSKWINQTKSARKIIEAGGRVYEYDFNPEDAHVFFTNARIPNGVNGRRKSWALRASKNGVEIATRGERYHALEQHQAWMIDRGIPHINPASSEYRDAYMEQNT